MKITPELMAKATETTSVEEFLALAKEHEIELTSEEAEAYYIKLHPAVGELSDDELDNVSGGGCGGGGKEERTTGYYVAGDYVKFRYKGHLGSDRVYEGTVLKWRVPERGVIEDLIEFYDDDDAWGVHVPRQVWVDFSDIIGYATKRF